MAAKNEQKFVFFDKKIFKLKCEVSSLTQTFFFSKFLVGSKGGKNCRNPHMYIDMKYKNAQKSS